MNSAKPFIPIPPAPLPVPALCPCVHSRSEKCLAKRWQIDIELSQILHGCSCHCHFTSNGSYMPAGAWAARREQKCRDIERVKALNESRAQFSQKKKESVQ